MTTKQRIDFDLYKKEEVAPLGGGVISGGVAHAMSDNRSLKSVMDLFAPGCLVWWVSDGDWSMHELLMALIEKTGPAHVSISSYAMGETPARILAQLKQQRAILSLSCVLDDRIDVRSAGSLQLIKSICDEINLLKTHAKVTLLMNEHWQVTVVGSANYTENKRFETGIITTDQSAYEFNNTWIRKALKDGNK
jgi:hypothetical protein